VSDQSDGSQGQLFSDAAVGAPAYDEVDTDLVGYRGPTACAAAGITYRQLDYWARTGLVAPSVRSATGSGTQRLYSFRDILVLKVVKRLLDTGVSLQNIRKAVDHLRTRGIKDLANVTLFSDGATVYECTSAEEVVDLLAGGQGVFGIAVSGALRELSGELAELPAERLDGGPVHSADDELSMRRPPADTAARCPSRVGGLGVVAPSGPRRGPRRRDVTAQRCGGRHRVAVSAGRPTVL
jgi:DNA-binding transcriptional MerR regulator